MSNQTNPVVVAAMDAEGTPFVSKMAAEDFIFAFANMQKAAHELAVSKGWWETERSDAEIIATLHSEISEAFEAMREPVGKPSTKVPELRAVEEELADLVIRVMDYAQRKGLQIGAGVVLKTRFNETRPHRHGGKRF